MTPSTASGRMIVSVRLFAAYADLIGSPRVEISVPEGATVGDLLDALRLQVPASAGLPPRPLCAVNLAHVLPAHPLHEGDEVAILPPLAGG